MNKVSTRIAFLIGLLALITVIYLPGITGALYYDDLRPLSGLSQVGDIYSALIYIFSETSGPLGRSLSMLTFALQANDWPSTNSVGDLSNFLLFNVLLHALNGLLIFGLSYFILILYRGANKDNYWWALAVSAFWLVLPMHVSTSLITIQRMAGLSAFFVFAGLLIYVYGLTKQNNAFNLDTQNQRNSGLGLQLLGLVLFTILAMFSKENGALLPIFVLVLEITLFAHITGIKYRQNLRKNACLLGLVLLLCFMVYASWSHGNLLSRREFTLAERLMTQPQILLDYIQLSFFPVVTSFNPFHDNYIHITNLFTQPKAFFALIVLLTSLITAVIYRKNHPLYAFAVLWFLVAHLLESTAFNLELYFEHRNYVALFGPCLALVSFLLNYTEKASLTFKKLMLLTATTYWLFLTFNLALTTKLWGEPNIAAERWFTEQTGSYRASANYAEMLYKQGNPLAAKQVFELQIKNCPSCIMSHAHGIFSSCLIGDDSSTQNNINNFTKSAESASNFAGVATTLNQIFLTIKKQECTLLDYKDIKVLNNNLLEIPRSRFSNKLSILKNLYAIALAEHNRDEAIRILELAWLEKNDIGIAKELSALLVAAKKYKQALKLVNEDICQDIPWNPVIASDQTNRCNKLRDNIRHKIKSIQKDNG